MFQVASSEDLHRREDNNTSPVPNLTWIMSNLTLVPIYIGFFTIAIRQKEAFAITSDCINFVLPLYWFGLKVDVKEHCKNRLMQLKIGLDFGKKGSWLTETRNLIEEEKFQRIYGR